MLETRHNLITVPRVRLGQREMKGVSQQSASEFFLLGTHTYAKTVLLHAMLPSQPIHHSTTRATYTVRASKRHMTGGARRQAGQGWADNLTHLMAVRMVHEASMASLATPKLQARARKKQVARCRRCANYTRVRDATHSVCAQWGLPVEFPACKFQTAPGIPDASARMTDPVGLCRNRKP